MEYALEEHEYTLLSYVSFPVLILVLMEYALGEMLK